MREKEGSRFGLVSIINHWTVAFMFLSVLSLGFYLDYMGDGRGPGGPWMGAHKAAGVLVLVVALWRLSWRLRQGFPKDSSPMPTWQVISAKLVHWLLLFATITMPISGILMSIYGDRPINVFGLFVIPTQPENEFINRVCDIYHWCLSYIVALAILLHVGAVAKHHFIDRDDTLKRMLKPMKRRRAEKQQRARKERV